MKLDIDIFLDIKFTNDLRKLDTFDLLETILFCNKNNLLTFLR
jgi:hypothetical protein